MNDLLTAVHRCKDGICDANCPYFERDNCDGRLFEELENTLNHYKSSLSLIEQLNKDNADLKKEADELSDRLKSARKSLTETMDFYSGMSDRYTESALSWNAKCQKERSRRKKAEDAMAGIKKELLELKSSVRYSRNVGIASVLLLIVATFVLAAIASYGTIPFWVAMIPTLSTIPVASCINLDI